MSKSEHYRAQEQKYYLQLVKRLPPVIVSGDGAYVTDVDGTRYLDFTAGWATLNVGHSHPQVTAALREQAGKVIQMTNMFYTTPQLGLAELLVENSCFARVFFCNSGAEANEGACKLARKWGRTHRNGAYEIITTLNSFHGRTLAMMAATGQPRYHDDWRPLMEGFVHAEYGSIDAVKRLTSNRTCAVLVEPVQGEGGVNVPPPEYLAELQEWCNQNGILLMLDEIQTGMGRLGALFGYQLAGITPDVMTLGKAVGGGTPLGAFLCREEVAVLEPGEHGTTFGGNALTTAAGAAAMRVILDEDIVGNVNAVSCYTFDQLGQLQAELGGFIQQVRGLGLLIGIELATDSAMAIVKRCIDKGVLFNAVRPNVLRLMPPLTIDTADVNMAVGALREAIQEL